MSHNGTYQCSEAINGFVICFGCCSVVNGALEYLAKDLGIAENAVIQGKCSNLLD
jgi:hypothetical protein